MSNLLSNIKSKNKIRAKTKNGILFCDGGSRGNPGITGTGAVLYDSRKKELGRAGGTCGIQTNNFAEYMALISGLNLAQKNNITNLKIFLDSKLLVEQMKGKWKIKNWNLRPLFEKAQALSENFAKISFFHIPREKNTVADTIANQMMDSNKSGKI